MNYREFCETVRDRVQSELLTGQREGCFELREMNKMNQGTMTGLVYRTEGLSVSPVMYMDELYEKYEAGESSIDELAAQVADVYRTEVFTDKAMINNDHGKMVLDWNTAKDHLFISAVGYSRNEEKLKNTPFFAQGDIAGVYRVQVDLPQPDTRGTVLVDNTLLDIWGVSKEQLHEAALENSPRIHPAVCRSIGQVLSEIVFPGGDGPFDLGNTDTAMYVLSNTELVDGAGVLFYPELLDKIAEQIPEGFYILPSSTEEVLIVPRNSGDREELSMMVREINRTQVDPKQQLSDLVHEYDPETRKLTCEKGIDIPLVDKTPAPELEKGKVI